MLFEEQIVFNRVMGVKMDSATPERVRAALQQALTDPRPSATALIPQRFAQLRQMVGWILPSGVTLEGFWSLPNNDPVFRLPVLAAFIAIEASSPHAILFDMLTVDVCRESESDIERIVFSRAEVSLAWIAKAS